MGVVLVRNLYHKIQNEVDIYRFKKIGTQGIRQNMSFFVANRFKVQNKNLIFSIFFSKETRNWHEGILFDLVSIVSVVIYISSSQKYLQWFEENGNKNAQKFQINVSSLLSVVPILSS